MWVKQFIIMVFLFFRPIVSVFKVHTSKMFSTCSISKGIIIGAGRIGTHLYESNNQQDILMKRKDVFPVTDEKSTSGPIYVCVRNDDLEKVIESIPMARRNDLVFVQNSVLAPVLQKYHLDHTNCTQALIYYGITKKGDPPIDGKTDVNPEGLTAVTGKWSQDFANRLAQTGLSCHIYDYPTWQVAMVCS